MMRSMTGYGRAETQGEGYTITLELKSINGRYFECQFRGLPKVLSDSEIKLANLLKEKLVRGKVMVRIQLDLVGAQAEKNIDFSQLLHYHETLSTFALVHGLHYSANIESLLSLPHVISEGKDFDEREKTTLEKILFYALDEALKRLLEEEKREGEAICLDILDKITHLKTLVRDLQDEEEALIKDYMSRLKKRIAQLAEVAENDDRLLQEVAILTEKTTIDEELTRLKTHLSGMEAMCQEPVVGRKLDFMLQELNREINTIGSKIQTVTLSQKVVMIKSILENIREQVQNIV